MYIEELIPNIDLETKNVELKGSIDEGITNIPLYLVSRVNTLL